MMNKIMMSIDAGKGETKYTFEQVGTMIKDIFATRGRELRKEEDAELSDGNYEVEFKGLRWGIGDNYETKDNNNTKNTELHKIAIYTAITKALTENTHGNEITLVVTAPGTLANNIEAKTEFANALKGNVDIRVNNKPYFFYVDKVAIKAEGTGVLYKETNLFKDKNVLSVDLGYLNLNACAINRMKILQDSIITDVLGMQTLHVKLNDTLNYLNEGRKLSTQKLNDCLDNGFYKKGNLVIEESKKRIRTVKENFLNEVITTLQEKHYLNDYDLIVFSGATSKVINDTIKNKIDNAYIVEDSQYANVIGNYYWMKAKLS